MAAFDSEAPLKPAPRRSSAGHDADRDVRPAEESELLDEARAASVLELRQDAQVRGVSHDSRRQRAPCTPWRMSRRGSSRA
jgi:hypothetical protein